MEPTKTVSIVTDIRFVVYGTDRGDVAVRDIRDMVGSLFAKGPILNEFGRGVMLKMPEQDSLLGTEPYIADCSTGHHKWQFGGWSERGKTYKCMACPEVDVVPAQAPGRR